MASSSISERRTTALAQFREAFRRSSVLIYLPLLMLTLGTPATADYFSASATLNLYLLIALSTCGLHLISRNEKNWMRVDTVFLLGYMIVYYQWVVMIQLSAIMPNNFFSITAVQLNVVFGTWLATVGLLAWAIGYSVFSPRLRWVSERILGTNRAFAVFIILFVMFIVTVGPAYLTGSIYSQVRQGGYVTMSGPSAYIFALLEVVVVVMLAAIFYNHRKTTGSDSRNLSWLGIALIGGYCLVFSVAGERGAVIAVLGASAVLFCSSRRPIGALAFVMLSLGGAFIFSTIGLLRGGFASAPSAIFDGEGLYGLTLNLANSDRAFFLGLQIVAQRGELFLGQLWISSVLDVFPFAQSAFLKISGMTQWDINSAYKIAYYHYGANPNTGDGTTMVGDIYMNFGTVGVFIFMGLYGIVSRRMQHYASGKHGFIYFAAAALFSSQVFYISRATFFFQLRPVVWGLLLIPLLFRLRRVR